MNVLEFECPLCDAPAMMDLDSEAGFADMIDRTERAIVGAVLKKTGGNATAAARLLKLEPHQIRYYIKKHSLK